jgi:acetyl-CoA carboxylase biotin carboxylase subunit
MLKAAAGGGGKGMRLVLVRAELASALEAARSEAQRAFGDGEVYIEKAIINPRHIEMQVLADEHGNTVYLGERDCSVQRRHQKVVEECPSPAVNNQMRQRMGEIAVKAAQAAAYTNAGTIEFLADRNNDFYFLEMNTRLQVEHPVTELVTGMDLVQLQIRIAAGEKLPFRQQDIQLRGHAVECRIYAEDPENNYFPSPGEITSLNEPSGPGIRVDSGVYAGWNVPIEYDPLLAKLIGYGGTREQAIARLRRALQEYFVGGVKTNIALFERILSNPEFSAGEADTGLLARMPFPRSPAGDSDEKEREVAAIAAGIFQMIESRGGNAGSAGAVAESSAWKKVSRMEGLQ